ncbi:MAG: hypothetical protein OXC40_05250 [Proteobacteria bacterium]|nr:hypothetical protein [Pseudomonadota bacterium]
MSRKRQNGQFYTKENPFQHQAFYTWAQLSDLPNTLVLEPFAGANGLIDHLVGMDLCGDAMSYDIAPGHHQVQQRDTLRDFPKGFSVCVTNPPWLARNSATVRGLDFPGCRYHDLYQYALEQCLKHCEWVAALLPESFIRSGLFRERLTDFISLTSNLFTDTKHPVGLALFQPIPVKDVNVWSGVERVGLLSEIEFLRPKPKLDGPKIQFNMSRGNVGLIALDNTREASIRFCDVAELAEYEVKKTGRHITKLAVAGDIDILVWNEYINRFRHQTKDVLMTCYKGMRKDGKYRRRLDWDLARGIVHHVS